MRFNAHALANGLSLVEVLVVVAVSAVLLAVATPVLSGWGADKTLRGATDVVMADLRLAMSESVKRGSAVTLKFSTSGGGSVWCYAVMMDNVDCDCSSGDGCTDVGVLQVRSGTELSGLVLMPGVSQNKFVFQPYRRTVTAGNVRLQSETGKQTKLVVAGYGRIRACSPAGAQYVSGFTRC